MRLLFLLFLLLAYADFSIVSPSESKSYQSTEGDRLEFVHQFALHISFNIPSDKLIYPASPSQITAGSTVTVCKDTPVSITAELTNSISNIRTTVITNRPSLTDRCSGYSGSGYYGYGDYYRTNVCGKIEYGVDKEGWDYVEFKAKVNPTLTIAGQDFSSSTATRTLTISSDRVVDFGFEGSGGVVGIYYNYMPDGFVSKSWRASVPPLSSYVAFVIVDPNDVPVTVSLDPTSVTMRESPYSFNLTITNTGAKEIRITSIVIGDARITLDAPTGQVIAPGSSTIIPITLTSDSYDNFTTSILVEYETTEEVCGETLSGSSSVEVVYVAPGIPMADLLPIVDYTRSGDDITIDVRVRNEGDKDTEDDVYLKVENVSPNSGFYVYNLGPINAENEKQISLDYRCESPDQIIKVNFIVDPNDLIPESNEDNNEASLTIYCSLRCEFNPDELSFDDVETLTSSLSCGGENCENVNWDPLNYFEVLFSNPVFSITPADDLTGTASEVLRVRAERGTDVYNCELPISATVDRLSECRKRI